MAPAVPCTLYPAHLSEWSEQCWGLRTRQDSRVVKDGEREREREREKKGEDEEQLLQYMRLQHRPPAQMK